MTDANVTAPDRGRPEISAILPRINPPAGRNLCAE